MRVEVSWQEGCTHLWYVVGFCSLAILLPNSTTFALLGNLSSYGRCDMVLLRNNQTIGQYLGQEQCAVDMQHAWYVN